MNYALPIQDTSSRRFLIFLASILACMDDAQVEPLWPSLSETPVPVDTALFQQNTTGLTVIPDDEDIVFWAN